MADTKKTPLARQRRLEILSELEDHGAVRVAYLAQRFRVAEETIRRDLDKLSEAGQLARTHGGALSVRSQRFDLPSAIRRNAQAAEKRRIATLALSHIEPNDVVALDASTTVLELACLLPDMPLTVITYGLEAARLLVDRPQVKVVCTGGELDAKSVCMLGPIAEKSLRRFSINKAFFSCKGVDLNRGYCEATVAHASIKRLLMQLASRAYMLVDHSKFGVRSLTYSGRVQDVDVVITDNGSDESFLDSINELGVETEVAASKLLPFASERTR